MIWIVGGTTETQDLLDLINGQLDYIVTVATYSGKEVLRDSNVVAARMNKEDMINFINDRAIDTVVDMSHPYAVEVSKNAKEVCFEKDIRYIRYLREETDTETAIHVRSIEECMEFLKKIQGCVFFTTGMKNIKDFEKVKGNNRFVYRVLPSLFSIQECVDNGLQMKDIIGILGPISKELNVAMFKDYGANYVIMKDSGKTGGTPEKIAACKELGITPVVIGRVREEGIRDIKELVSKIAIKKD